MTSVKNILIRNIYYMLSYAFQELRQNDYSDIAGEPFDEIHDLFTEILIRAISLQLKKGFYREYIDQTDISSTLRGKIDMEGTMSQRMRRSNYIICHHDELTEDNIYNQIVATTAGVLLRCSDVDAVRRNRLKRLMSFFSTISRIDKDAILWENLHFGRSNQSYRLLINICYFLLDGMLLTTDDGKYHMKEFSDDNMNRLFEKFVLEYYRKHYPYLNARPSKIDWNINKELSYETILPQMKTDIMLTLEGHTLIIDTKFYGSTMQKQFGKSTIHSHNLYQIHTYITEYDVEKKGVVDGMLLYAKTDEDITPAGQMKLADGKTIYFRTLDLNKDFKDIRKSLDDNIQPLLQVKS